MVDEQKHNQQPNESEILALGRRIVAEGARDAVAAGTALTELRVLAEWLKTHGVTNEPGDTPPRRIAVATSSRADYSHLYWVLRELDARDDVELGLIVFGAHLAPEFGHTINEIERDGFPCIARIESLLSSDTDTGMAKSIGIATLGFSDALTNWRPDILLLIADRYEMLAPASVALALRIPVAHIEGGEISQGAIDDAVRNAITKLAHIHFTSTPTARRRVIGMGEEPWRVHHAGAPSLDHITRSELLARAEVERELSLLAGHSVSITKPSLLVAFHPATVLNDTTAEAEAFFSALQSLSPDHQLLFVYPNADAGSRALLSRAKSIATTRERTEIFVNLNPILYWSLMRVVDCVVGNSSSGIMEAASFTLPVVDIGIRQQGRERARNVITTPASRDEILSAIHQALMPDFRASLSGLENPYGNGTAAKTIANALATTDLDHLLVKAPAPLAPEDTQK